MNRWWSPEPRAGVMLADNFDVQLKLLVTHQAAPMKTWHLRLPGCKISHHRPLPPSFLPVLMYYSLLWRCRRLLGNFVDSTCQLSDWNPKSTQQHTCFILLATSKRIVIKSEVKDWRRIYSNRNDSSHPFFIDLATITMVHFKVVMKHLRNTLSEHRMTVGRMSICWSRVAPSTASVTRKVTRYIYDMILPGTMALFQMTSISLSG